MSYPFRIDWGLSSTAVTYAEMVRHLRLLGNDGDQTYVEECVAAATNYFERIYHHIFAARNITINIDYLPSYYNYVDTIYNIINRLPVPARLMLPIHPVNSIISLSYIDTDGVLQNIDPTTLQLSGTVPRSIAPAPGQFWPLTEYFRIGSVNIVVNAGYATIPPHFKHAIRLLAANYYENREPVTKQYAQALPLGLTNLTSGMRWH